MNNNYKKNIRATHEKMRKGQRLYGTTVMGARGQVVIPAEARKDFNLKPGQQLVIMGNKIGKVLTIIETENLNRFVEMITKHLEGSGIEEDVQKHFNKIIKKVNK